VNEVFYLLEWIKVEKGSPEPLGWISTPYQNWETAFGAASSSVERYLENPLGIDFTILEAPEGVSLDFLYANLLEELGRAA
jgi:hypothetical protein